MVHAAGTGIARDAAEVQDVRRGLDGRLSDRLADDRPAETDDRVAAPVDRWRFAVRDHGCVDDLGDSAGTQLAISPLVVYSVVTVAFLLVVAFSLALAWLIVPE